MRLATKKALLASIDKWKQYEDISSLDQVTIGRSSCPLCIRFGDECERSFAKTTEVCPVYNATGETDCEFTPFENAYEAYYYERLHTFRRQARREREFLESLLPSPKK